MRIMEGEGYRISYPDEIIFAFNPQRIVVEAEQEACTFGFIADGVDTLHDERVFYDGRCEIDFAKYAQLIFKRKERHKALDVVVDMSLGSFTLSFKVVWGVVNIGEEWNAPRAVKWFKRFPQTFGVYIPEGVAVEKREDGGYSPVLTDVSGFNDIRLLQVFPTAQTSAGLRVLNGVQASVFDETFDITFGTKDVQTWTFEVDDSDSGVFLRWVDRHGWLQYWLFKEGVQAEKSKSEGDELSVSFTDDRDLSHYGVVRENKSLSRSLKCGAVLLNEDDRRIVSSIASSPYVDWWNGRAWVPVRISGTTLSDKRGGLVDYEVEVVFPNVITQRI